VTDGRRATQYLLRSLSDGKGNKKAVSAARTNANANGLDSGETIQLRTGDH